MSALRSVPRLVAGLFAFDILVNLPAFSTAHPVGSLIAPSIDLLVAAAALWGAAQAGERPRRTLRIVICALLLLLLAAQAALRFGIDVPARMFGRSPGLAVLGWVVSLVIVAAAGVAAYLSSGLVVRGFAPAIVRNVFLVVVAALAVLQAVTRTHLLAPSALPRLFRALFTGGM
jgi:hypothetical protein